MKNPVKILQEEHKLLLQAVETGKHVQDIADDKLYYKLMHDLIIFLRNYTEIYHHPKEENILYPLLQGRSENMGEHFIHEVCDNHEDFKSLMAEMETYYIMYDYRKLRKTMIKYLTLLSEHIKRENKIILSVANQLLTTKESENIYDQFSMLDQKYGEKESLQSSLYQLSLQIA